MEKQHVVFLDIVGVSDLDLYTANDLFHLIAHAGNLSILIFTPIFVMNSFHSVYVITKLHLIVFRPQSI